MGDTSRDVSCAGYTFIGVDPGFRGALSALYCRCDGDIVAISVEDMPIVSIPNRDHGTRREYDLVSLCAMVKRMCAVQSEPEGKQRIVHAAIERQHARPDDGVSSAFRIGEGYGIFRALFMTNNVVPVLVSPVTWKMRFDLLKRGKQEARVRAMAMFPDVDLRLKKHDGRADALWLALYLRDVVVHGNRGASAQGTVPENANN